MFVYNLTPLYIHHMVEGGGGREGGREGEGEGGREGGKSVT